MQPVEVTARWLEDGSVIPTHFQIKHQAYIVESVGRSWLDEAGLHILVMVPGRRVYELVFQPDSLRWSGESKSPPVSIV